MTTAVDVIRLAKSQNGVTEGPEPNRVIYNEWFYKGQKVTFGEKYAWCHVFVAWLFDQLGSADLFPKTASCSRGIDWFIERKAFITDHKKFVAGDCVYFNFSHIEIFVKDNGDGTFTSVGGNTNSAGSRSGGQVYINPRRHYKDVKGAGRPAYAGAKKTFRLAGPIAAGALAAALGVGVGTLGVGNATKDTVLQPGTAVTVAPEVVVPTTIPTQPAVPSPPKTTTAPVQAPPVSRVQPVTSKPSQATSYRVGSKGPKVRIIQRKVGISGKSVDGVYGPKTKAAVIKWQKKNGLKQDGIVGPKTLKKMGIS